MKPTSRFGRLARLSVAIMTALAIMACGGRGPATYQGIELPRDGSQTDAPSAWLVSGKRAQPAKLAAFTFSESHADPAYGYPALEAMPLGADGLVIVIDSATVRQAEVSIREWSADGRIVPLFDDELRPLAAQLTVAGDLSALAIGAVPEDGDYLVRLHVTYPAGDAFYVWRLDTSG